MREDTKVTKVYRFEELSEKAQKKAWEELYDINVNYEWWGFVYEDAKNIGVKIEEFDLGQGSDCRGRFTVDELDVAEAILKDHGKVCETYQDAYEFVWDAAIAEDQRMDDFDLAYDCPELLEDFRRTIFEDYRIMLRKVYDYLTSDEAIKETIDANDYEFTEDGRIYR